MKLTAMCVAMFLPIGAVGAQAPAAGADPAADAATSALIQKSCAACHPITQVNAAHKSRDDWGATLDKMIGFGAQIADKDYDAMLDYLARHQGVEKK